MITDLARSHKRRQIQSVFNTAIQHLDANQAEQATTLYNQLNGMAGAFHLIDRDLYTYANECCVTYLQYSHQAAIRPFTPWAINQACNALRAAT